MKMNRRPRHAVVAVAAVAIAAVTTLPNAAHATDRAAQPTTRVEAQPGGGYITTYRAVNGDITKVFAAMPASLSVEPTTSRQVTVNGKTVTEHRGGVRITLRGTVDKPAILRAAPAFSGSMLSPYEELLAIGADPTNIASFARSSTMTDASSPLSPATSATVPRPSDGGVQIGPPACLDGTFDNGKGHVDGCDVTRKVGTSGSVWYLTDSTQSSGTMHDTGCINCDHLTGLKFGTQYGSGNTIQSWKPGGVADVGSCVQNTVSLSYQGAGVSSTATQCPETFGLYGKGITYYSTKWDGKGSGPSDGARDTHQVDGVYNGASASPYPGVFTSWWYTT